MISSLGFVSYKHGREVVAVNLCWKIFLKWSYWFWFRQDRAKLFSHKVEWFWDSKAARDGFRDGAAKKEFGQSGLTWLYSGDPATGLGVPRPFGFWKKSNQTDLGRAGKKLNQCIKGFTLMVHIQTQHLDKEVEKETPLWPILPAIV